MRVVILGVREPGDSRDRPVYREFRGREIFHANSGATPSRSVNFDLLTWEQKQCLAKERESERILFAIYFAAIRWTSKARAVLGYTLLQGGSGRGGLQGAHNLPFAGIRLVAPLSCLQQRIRRTVSFLVEAGIPYDTQAVAAILRQKQNLPVDLLSGTCLRLSANCVTILPWEINRCYDLTLERMGRDQMVTAFNTAGDLLHCIREIITRQRAIISSVDQVLRWQKVGDGRARMKWSWNKCGDAAGAVWKGCARVEQDSGVIESEITRRDPREQQDHRTIEMEVALRQYPEDQIEQLEPIDLLEAVFAWGVYHNEPQLNPAEQRVVELLTEVAQHLGLDRYTRLLDPPIGEDAGLFLQSLHRSDALRDLQRDEIDLSPDCFNSLQDRLQFWRMMNEEARACPFLSDTMVAIVGKKQWGKMVSGRPFRRLWPKSAQKAKVARTRGLLLLRCLKRIALEPLLEWIGRAPQQLQLIRESGIKPHWKQRFDELSMMCEAHASVSTAVLQELETEVRRILRLEYPETEERCPDLSSVPLEHLAVMATVGALSRKVDPVKGLAKMTACSPQAVGTTVDFEIVGALVGFAQLDGNPLPEDLDLLANKIQAIFPQRLALTGRCVVYE